MILELARQQEKNTFKEAFIIQIFKETGLQYLKLKEPFLYKYKMYQRIPFPLRQPAAKTIHKSQGITEDEAMIDLTQYKGVRKIPHIHYVALSRVRKLENLYILNLNEAAIGLDEHVNIEMQRLRTEAALKLSYTPLYKIDPSKIKLAFNNARSLHKHFKDVQFEPNMLSADVVGLLNLDCVQGMKMFILP